LEWQLLVFDGHHLRGVADHAVAVVVVADGAMQKVMAQDAVERLGPPTSTRHVSQVWIGPSCGW
jgi:hypothetical protein